MKAKKVVSLAEGGEGGKERGERWKGRKRRNIEKWRRLRSHRNTYTPSHTLKICHVTCARVYVRGPGREEERCL